MSESCFFKNATENHSTPPCCPRRRKLRAGIVALSMPGFGLPCAAFPMLFEDELGTYGIRVKGQLEDCWLGSTNLQPASTKAGFGGGF